MKALYFKNDDGSKMWIIQPGSKVLELFITRTNQGVYTRIAEYTATESDVYFIALTNNEIDRDRFFSLAEEVFDFYISIFH